MARRPIKVFVTGSGIVIRNPDRGGGDIEGLDWGEVRELKRQLDEKLGEIDARATIAKTDPDIVEAETSGPIEAPAIVRMLKYWSGCTLRDGRRVGIGPGRGSGSHFVITFHVPDGSGLVSTISSKVERRTRSTLLACQDDLQEILDATDTPEKILALMAERERTQ